MQTLLFAALAGRLALDTLPPGSFGLAAEVVKAPWVMRVDTAYMLSETGNLGIWAVTLAYPLWRLGDVQVGPLLGANGSLPGTPPRPKQIVLVGNSTPSLTVGARFSWQTDNWWITACPNVSLTGLTATGPPGWLAGLFFPVLGCPPVLEVGYQFTPAVGLALRASALPFGISWKF